MPNWNILETRNHIDRIYGQEQLDIAKISLNSISLRQEYARYHYHEANKIIDRFLKKEFKTKDNIEIIFMPSDEKEEVFTKVEANVLACLSNLHTILDTYSFAIYYTFGFNLTNNKLPERNIDTTSVLNIIKNDSQLGAIHTLLGSIKNGGDFEHLSAIVNHAKHRGVKRIKLSLSQNVTTKERYLLYIPAYEMNCKFFQEVEIKEFLKSEFNRTAKLVVDMGIAINQILAER